MYTLYWQAIDNLHIKLNALKVTLDNKFLQMWFLMKLDFWIILKQSLVYNCQLMVNFWQYFGYKLQIPPPSLSMDCFQFVKYKNMQTYISYLNLQLSQYRERTFHVYNEIFLEYRSSSKRERLAFLSNYCIPEENQNFFSIRSVSMNCVIRHVKLSKDAFELSSAHLLESIW